MCDTSPPPLRRPLQVTTGHWTSTPSRSCHDTGVREVTAQPRTANGMLPGSTSYTQKGTHNIDSNSCHMVILHFRLSVFILKIEEKFYRQVMVFEKFTSWCRCYCPLSSIITEPKSAYHSAPSLSPMITTIRFYGHIKNLKLRKNFIIHIIILENMIC